MSHAEWQRWRRCGRKIRHQTLHDANAVVLQYWSRGEWHVTSDETTRTEAA